MLAPHVQRLWNEYLETEKRRIRDEMMPALDRFIDQLLARPAEEWAAWARETSAAVADRDVAMPVRFPLFRRVLLPLTIPGIATGFVFVFVLSIGNFVTPALLGGKRVQMIGTLIYDQFLSARDWPFGSVLATFLIAIMMILLFLQALVSRCVETSAERADPRAMVAGHG